MLKQERMRNIKERYLILMLAMVYPLHEEQGGKWSAATTGFKQALAFLRCIIHFVALQVHLRVKQHGHQRAVLVKIIGCKRRARGKSDTALWTRLHQTLVELFVAESLSKDIAGIAKVLATAGNLQVPRQDIVLSSCWKGEPLLQRSTTLVSHQTLAVETKIMSEVQNQWRGTNNSLLVIIRPSKS